jgi:hypothetical protein
MFTEEHLRGLTAYLLETAKDLDKASKENPPSPSPLPNVGSGDPPQVTDDAIHALRSFARQIEVMGYDPILFAAMLENYDLKIGSLDQPLDNVPLHMNDEDPVSIAVVKWRLSNAV